MDPAPDPSTDPTSSLILRMQQKIYLIYRIIFSYFFLITCHQAHHLQSKKFNFLLKFCVKFLFCRHYLSPLNTSMRKGKDPDPDLWIMDPEPDTDLWLMDPDPGTPETCGSGSPTFNKGPSFRRAYYEPLNICRGWGSRTSCSWRRLPPPPPSRGRAPGGGATYCPALTIPHQPFTLWNSHQSEVYSPCFWKSF